MPYGGNDWLALAPEATLEPSHPNFVYNRANSY